jgi:transcriptional regulator with XRE-family HTH domain
MTQIIREWTQEMMQGAIGNDTKFFRDLGVRLAQLRKAQGLTQIQLADLLQVSQQQVASYEVGRRRIPISMLPTLAKIFGTSLESLLGVTTAFTKRGPTPLLQQQLERLNRLPRAKQRVVSEMLTGLLQQSGH